MTTDPKARLAAIRRVVAVQQARTDAQAWRLARLQREDADAAETEREMLAALGEGPLAGLFADAVSRRLKRVAERRQAGQAAIAAQTARLAAETGRLRHGESLGAAAAHAAAQADEARSLAEIVEAALAREVLSRSRREGVAMTCGLSLAEAEPTGRQARFSARPR